MGRAAEACDLNYGSRALFLTNMADARRARVRRKSSCHHVGLSRPASPTPMHSERDLGQ